MIWHNSEAADVLRELEVDGEKGLLSGVADERLDIFGKNSIGSNKKISFLNSFLKALNNKWLYILATISVLSVIVSLVYKQANPFSPLLIILILVINALISGYHNYKSECTVDTVHSVIYPLATVIRDGIEKQIPSQFLVPGDILILNSGDYITADARLLECSNFRTNENVISGVNIPVDKHAGITFEDITPIAQRSNMVFSGTNAIAGSAKAVVVETGHNTELGKTNEIIKQTNSEEFPIKNSLDTASNIINITVFVLCGIAFIIGILKNIHTTLPFASMTFSMLIDTVALGVAAIPESLSAISISVIALGIQRALCDNVIIKKSKALETLGKTDIICVDKTGILTSNTMILDRIFDGQRTVMLQSEDITEKASMAIRLSALCSTLNNDSTENAIKEASVQYNSQSLTDIENIYPRVATIPFDTDRKTMTSINMFNGSPLAIVKGAAETVADYCIDCDCAAIKNAATKMSKEGLRVLCVAIKKLDEIPANPSPDEIERNLTFVALLGLYDPPRGGAVNGIKACSDAGIRTVMMTGDNFETACAVARQIGILTDDSLAITGEQLSSIGDAEFDETIERYSVFARITPADKMRIISAWQKKGKTVTVTGDDIEDADALNLADVGIAMGKGGTAVARGNADVIIEHHNFYSLVNSIKQSRGLFSNIKKAVSYLLSCNISEILTFIIGLAVYGFTPLGASQLLWINLLTDSAPALSLAMENAENSVMKQKPSSMRKKLFDLNSVVLIAGFSLFLTVTALISFIIGIKHGHLYATTMAFSTISLSQILHAYNYKTDGTLFKCDFKSNKFMNLSTVLLLFVSIFLVVTPAGSVFGLTMLSSGSFFVSLAFSVLVIPFGELLKLLVKR